jgi:membrane-bound lytic murein transglycosylase D
MNYLDQHNFLDEGSEMTLPSDTVHVKKFLHFETFANLSGVCLEDLQKLNPSVTRNAIPDNSRTFILHVPSYARERFDANRVAIIDSASKVGKKELEALAKNSEGSVVGRDRIVYKVRSGDVLGSIAIRHGVKVADLKKWNNLRSNMIRSGQRLNIWLRPDARTAAVASSKPKSTSTTPAKVPPSKTYVVQEGDTLWDIARKFEGLTVEKIKSLNNMSNSKISAGQRLIIGEL